VNYAEEHVESYATSVVKCSTDILSANLSKHQKDNLSHSKNIKQSYVKEPLFKSRNASNLIPNNRIDNYKEQRIRLKQNFETQNIKTKKNVIRVPDRLIVNNEEELINKIDSSYANEDKSIPLEDAVNEIEKEAYADLKALNDYIMNSLQEPEIAHKNFKLIVDE